MAKKAVASLQTGSKKLAKAIRMVKKDGSSSYSFEERILPQDLVNDWLAGKPIVKKEAPKPTSSSQLQKKLRLKSQLQKKLRLKSQLQKKLRLKSQLQKKLRLKSQLQKKLRLKSQLQKKLRLKSQLMINLNNSDFPYFNLLTNIQDTIKNPQFNEGLILCKK
jgi:hypothetical protein